MAGRELGSGSRRTPPAPPFIVDSSSRWLFQDCGDVTRGLWRLPEDVGMLESMPSTLQMKNEALKG